LEDGGRRLRQRLREPIQLVPALLRELGDPARRRRDVPRELAERHRLLVRLPAELLVRYALEDTPRRRGLAVELAQDRFVHSHRRLLLFLFHAPRNAWSLSKHPVQPVVCRSRAASDGRSSCVTTTSVEPPRSWNCTVTS